MFLIEILDIKGRVSKLPLAQKINFYSIKMKCTEMPYRWYLLSVGLQS